MYTPEWVFDNLGYFDLDVCAPEGGISWIPALEYYTIKDDGLISPWHGRVWCNPPFDQCQYWMRKFMYHHNGVALVPVSKTKWFDELIKMDAKITILPSTLKFITPEGEHKSIRSPCCLVELEKN